MTCIFLDIFSFTNGYLKGSPSVLFFPLELRFDNSLHSYCFTIDFHCYSIEFDNMAPTSPKSDSGPIMENEGEVPRLHSRGDTKVPTHSSCNNEKNFIGDKYSNHINSTIARYLLPRRLALVKLAFLQEWIKTENQNMDALRSEYPDTRLYFAIELIEWSIKSWRPSLVIKCQTSSTTMQLPKHLTKHFPVDVDSNAALRQHLASNSDVIRVTNSRSKNSTDPSVRRSLLLRYEAIRRFRRRRSLSRVAPSSDSSWLYYFEAVQSIIDTKGKFANYLTFTIPRDLLPNPLDDVEFQPADVERQVMTWNRDMQALRSQYPDHPLYFDVRLSRPRKLAIRCHNCKRAFPVNFEFNTPLRNHLTDYVRASCDDPGIEFSTYHYIRRNQVGLHHIQPPSEEVLYRHKARFRNRVLSTSIVDYPRTSRAKRIRMVCNVTHEPSM